MLATSLPVSVIASWPKPNFINPVTRDWMPATTIVWQVASTILITGRFWLRARRQAGPFGWDDLLIFFAWLFSIPLSASAWADSLYFGIDRHTWDNKVEWAVGAALTGWISQLFFVLSTVCTKICVLLFYKRMIKDTIDRRWLWALRGALAFTTCYGITITVSLFCICRPMHALWRAYDLAYDEPYTCINGKSLTVVAGIISVVSDLLAVAIPCLMLRHYDLNASYRQKIALNATFGAGLIVTACGVARSYYVWRVQHTSDPTWTGFEMFAWSIVECHLAMICACAPSLRVFFRRYLAGPIKRMTSNMGHYAPGSREPTARNSVMVSAGNTKRQSRRFHELQELESGVHGVAYPPPVIVTVSRKMDDATPRDSLQVQQRERPPTPKITSAEQYTGWAIERTRLSRQNSIMTRSNNISSTKDGLDEIVVGEKPVERHDSHDAAS